MSSAVVSPSSFDTNKITISPPKLLPSNAKQAYLNYDGRSLTMQVGSLSIPYGMSVFDKAGPVKYSVDLSLRGYDGENAKVKSIYDAFSAIDEYMIQQGVKNSKSWFKQEMGREIIKAFYAPCIRVSKDADGNPKPYPPTLKIALKKRDDKFETLIYDENKQAITDISMEDVLLKGTQITTLIQCTGVWFAGTKYGLSWKAVQIRVDKMVDGIRGYSIMDDDEAPRKSAAPVPVKSQPAPVQNKFNALQMEDDEQVDDEEVFQQPPPRIKVEPQPQPQEEDEEAEDMAPVAVPKKTITKKSVMKVVAKK